MTRLEEVLIKEQRLHELMESKSLTGILLKKQANFSWFTAGGLNMVGIASEMGVTALLITREGRYLIANRIEAGRMLNDEGLGELGFELLEYEWFADREAELARQVAGDLAKVGADVPFANCPNLDGAIKELRYCLTENEIERYRFLGRKLSLAVEKTMLGIKPGDSECEIAGRIGALLWPDRIDPTGFLIASDERIYSYRHPIPTAKLIRRYVMVSVNARYQGLITTITRMLHFGKPDPGLLRQYQDNLEIDCRMIAATRPGVPLNHPFKTGLAAYGEFGYPDEWRLHHQGGAMGYYARDIKVTGETEDTARENQAFCWNPSITGTKTEDGFIAAAAGPLLITAPVAYPAVNCAVDGVLLSRPGMLVVD